jgi:aerobic-type carbon monoxide dehydrogenase small subunit (CoxS/CutS family)
MPRVLRGHNPLKSTRRGTYNNQSGMEIRCRFQMTMITLRVNGRSRELEADPATPLIFVLRNGLGLTGAKLGCGLEQCGACAVLVDGEPVLSCVRAVSEFEGCDIVTVEGLAGDGTEDGASEIQRAFIAEGAAQCGYCTPGIVVAVTALLRRNSTPDDAEIREALHGHLCRCGSHVRVLRAIDRLIRQGASDGV